MPSTLCPAERQRGVPRRLFVPTKPGSILRTGGQHEMLPRWKGWNVGAPKTPWMLLLFQLGLGGSCGACQAGRVRTFRQGQYGPHQRPQYPQYPQYGGDGYEVSARRARLSRWRQVAKASVSGWKPYPAQVASSSRRSSSADTQEVKATASAETIPTNLNSRFIPRETLVPKPRAARLGSKMTHVGGI